jgi:hypothetical protein
VSGRQTEELTAAGRRRIKLAQRAQQAEDRFLKDIAGVGQAADVGKATQHAMGQPFEPAADGAQQLVRSGGVAGVHAPQPIVQLGRLKG